MSYGKTVVRTVYKTSGLGNIFGWFLAIATSIIGHEIHGSIGWAIINFFFWGWSWLFWLIGGKVNLTIIKNAFSFFLQ